MAQPGAVLTPSKNLLRINSSKHALVRTPANLRVLCHSINLSLFNSLLHNHSIWCETSLPRFGYSNDGSLYLCFEPLFSLWKQQVKCSTSLLGPTQHCKLRCSTDTVIPTYQAIQKNPLTCRRREASYKCWFRQKTSSIWYTTFRIHFGGYLICQ